MSIVISNLDERIEGPCTYEIAINDLRITTFKHDRSLGLHECLAAASDALGPHPEITSALTTIRKTLALPTGISLNDAVTRMASWGSSLDRDRLENLSKWARIINACCGPDQPELLIEIDIALSEGRRAAAYRGALQFVLDNSTNQTIRDRCLFELQEQPQEQPGDARL